VPTPLVEVGNCDSLISNVVSRSKGSGCCAGLWGLTFLGATRSFWWVVVCLNQPCARARPCCCARQIILLFHWAAGGHPDTSSKRMTIYLTHERHHMDVTWSLANS